MVVLASAGGNTVPAIARLVQADEDTIRQVIHRFNEMGMAGAGDVEACGGTYDWAGSRSASISGDVGDQSRGMSLMSDETTTRLLRDRSGRTISLAEITDDNWRAVADVAPHDEQRRFVAALGARYLLLSMRGGLWHSLAIEADNAVVGHVMWAYDNDAGTHWIGGMLIDAAEQGKGVGRAALQATMRLLSGGQNAQEIRLSYHLDNTAAARLYADAGFRPTGDTEDGEIVVARPVNPATRH